MHVLCSHSGLWGFGLNTISGDNEVKIAIAIYGRGYPYVVGGAEIFAYRLAHELTKYHDVDDVLLLQGGLSKGYKIYTKR